MMAFLLLFFVSNLFTFLKPQQIILPASLSSCQGFTISRSAPFTNFPYSMDGGGDVNNDGFPDFALADYPYPSASIIYIVYGNPTGYPTDIDIATLTPSQGFTITGAILLGYDNTNLITIAGDVDGDGIADIVIGAGGTSSNQGAAYVVYGKTGGYSSPVDVTSLTSNVGFKISGGGGYLGWSVSTKVDLNGDTINDIAVTAKFVSTNYGAAYVVFGQQTRGGDVDLTAMLPTRGFTISGFSGAMVGPIGSAGDFNGDGVDDLIVTAPGASSGAGIAYVIYGKKSGLADFALSPSGITQGFMFSGVSPIESLATLPAEAGDFNGDGISDIVLGTFGASSSTGYAYILYGKKGGQPDFSTASILPSQGFKIAGLNVNDCLGSSFASVPDVNGDGISDLLIGARGYDSNRGAIYGIYGRKDNPSTIDISNLTPDQGFTIFGPTISSYLGGSMSSIKDINQDGMPDILISVAQKPYVFFSPNAWLCDTCETSRICQTCLSSYNHTADGHCYSKCPISYPYELDYECFTEDPSEPKEEEEDINVELKNAIKGSGTATSVVNKLRNLWKPSRAVSFMYGQIRTTIIYMRYLNISRTLKLERVYQLYDDSDLEFIPSITMPDSIKDAFPNEPLPYMLEKYELPSSFIANFGDDLVGMMIVSVLIVTMKLISFLGKNRIKNHPTVKKILHRVLITLENNLIGSFIESTGPIIFFATLDYRTSTADKGYYILSPLICTLCIILVLAVMSLNIWVLKKFETARKASKKSDHPEKIEHKAFEEIEEKYESIGVLFEEFDDSSIFRQSACFFYCLWALTQSLVIAVFFEYPLAQSIILVVLTWKLLLYLLIKRPFKSKLDITQQLILIPALFTINICLMMMAGTNPTHDDFQSTKLHTSNTIFWILLVFQFVPLFFFAIELIGEIRDFCQWLSTIRKSSNAKIHPQPAQPRLQSPSTSSLLTQTRMGFNHSRTQLVDKGNLLSPVSSQTSIFKMDMENHPVRSPSSKQEQIKLLSAEKFSSNSEMSLSPKRRKRIPKPSEKRKSNLQINFDGLE